MFEVLSFIINLVFKWFFGFFTEWEYFFGTLFVGVVVYYVFLFGKIEKGSFYDPY